MLNRQRCILCACVRFMREVDGDAQINVVDRGNGSQIATFQEEGVHSLLSGNLMDVCPVGAITTRDYRFKSRPWDNRTPSIPSAPSAPRAATTAWVKAKPEWAKGSRLIRLTPRFNPDINDYWMCDIGRFEYHWVEGDNRATRPLVGQQNVSWRDLMTTLADKLRAAGTAKPDGLRFLLSAHASHEELFLFRCLTDALTGSGVGAVTVSWRYRPKPQHARFAIPAVDARTSTAPASWGSSAVRSATPWPRPTCLRCGRPSRRVRCPRCTSSIPGRTARLATQWVIDARTSGTLPLLIVQGVLRQR
jgi:NADH-quinone oxidoreductase subunit G